MQISYKDWLNYINKLSKLNKTAGQKMVDFVTGRDLSDPQPIIDYAYALVTKYGEGSAALSAAMYDAIAEASKKMVPAAEVAPTADYDEVARAVQGTMKQSKNPKTTGSTVSRLVKQAGADTMLKNAARDGAQFAWVPVGDTCPFCITLASRGFQKMSKKALKNGHAEHIHANCDCNYTVRFDNTSGVEGYDPDKYLEQYNNAEGDTPKEKINSMRRAQYAADPEKYRAQKRAAYAERKGSTVYEGIPKNWKNIGVQSTDDAMKGCNPNYKQELPDHLLGTKEDYTNNCANSVVAFEMRKRGYPVTACSLGENKRLKKNPFSAWIGRTPERTKGSGLDEILSFMTKEEDGTRIEIAIRYSNETRGHTFISEKRDGKIIFLDPQRNRIIDEKIFTKAEENATMFMKINDLEISDRGVAACKKE